MAPMASARLASAALTSRRLPYELATSSREVPSTSGELASPVSTTSGAATSARRPWRRSISAATDRTEPPTFRTRVASV